MMRIDVCRFVPKRFKDNLEVTEYNRIKKDDIKIPTYEVAQTFYASQVDKLWLQSTFYSFCTLLFSLSEACGAGTYSLLRSEPRRLR